MCVRAADRLTPSQAHASARPSAGAPAADTQLGRPAVTGLTIPCHIRQTLQEPRFLPSPSYLLQNKQMGKTKTDYDPSKGADPSRGHRKLCPLETVVQEHWIHELRAEWQPATATLPSKPFHYMFTTYRGRTIQPYFSEKETGHRAERLQGLVARHVSPGGLCSTPSCPLCHIAPQTQNRWARTLERLGGETEAGDGF